MIDIKKKAESLLGKLMDPMLTELNQFETTESFLASFRNECRDEAIEDAAREIENIIIAKKPSENLIDYLAKAIRGLKLNDMTSRMNIAEEIKKVVKSFTITNNAEEVSPLYYALVLKKKGLSPLVTIDYTAKVELYNGLVFEEHISHETLQKITDSEDSLFDYVMGLRKKAMQSL